MYEAYFSFKQAPFSIAPDPSFLYPSPQHQKGLEQLLYGLNKEGGFIVLTGEVGTGKTTLCRLLLNKLDRNIMTANLYNSKLSASELLRGIATSFGLDINSDASEFEITAAIEALLRNNHDSGKKTLVIVEEAQNLSPDALETLRLLTNFETDTTKLIHILLIGQPELVTTLNRPDLRQLNQRVIARYHLRPLTASETEMYVVHRLSVVGGQQSVFKDAALRTLFSLTQGVPRLINLIADKALQSTYEANEKFVTAAAIESANEAIHGHLPVAQQPKAQRNLPAAVIWGAAALIVFLSVSITLWLTPAASAPHTSAPSAVPQSASPSQPISSTPLSTGTVENTTTAATSKPPFNAEQQLLSQWNINELRTSLERDGLCKTANRHDLDCLDNQSISYHQLKQFNRPAVVTLFNQSGIAEHMVLHNIHYGTVELVNASGVYTLPEIEFQQRWRGNALMLWRPAPGFIDTVRSGDKSHQVINWLQQSLQDLDYVDGKIITGGIYSQLLIDHVTRFQAEHGLGPDGALGVKTIIAINSALKQSPVLISG